MRKRTILIFTAVAISLIFCASLLGCAGKPEAGKTDGAAQEEGTPQETPQKAIELTLASPFPANHHQQVEVLEPLVEEIKEKTNGRIIIHIHAGGSLSGGTAVADDTATGAVDIGWTMQGYTPGRFPLTALAEFSGLFSSATEAGSTLWKLLEQNEAFQEEYKDYKVMAFLPPPPGNVYTVDRPIRGIKDFKGLHLRTSTAFAEAVVSALGGTAANIPMGEVYDALERGVIGGLCTDHTAINTYKHYEVIHHAVDGIDLFLSPQIWFFSKKSWDKLPAEDQAILESLFGLELSKKCTGVYDSLSSVGYQVMVDHNIEIYKWTEENKQELKKVVDPLIEEYIAEQEAKGLPARQVYEEMLAIRDSLR